ncbi:MAG: hypothetical protein OEV94_02740 [Deltaproteobacteria bacterium]|nr:hypothetical protein [Deltaproteobacteria bacterium]
MVLLYTAGLFVGSSAWALGEAPLNTGGDRPDSPLRVEIGLVSNQEAVTGWRNGGLHIGYNYPIPLSQEFDLGLVFEMSLENSMGDFPGAAWLSSGLIGMEARYWMGSHFVAVRGGGYYQTATVYDANLDMDAASGPGQGVVLGWESPETGIQYMLSVGQGKVRYYGSAFAYPKREYDLTSVRLTFSMPYKG